MAYVVLVTWLVQGAAGIVLLTKWLRHGRRGATTVLTHVACGVVALGFWIAFLATGAVAFAWTAFVIITIGNGIGDSMLVQRWRRTTGQTNGYWQDYGQVVKATLTGRVPASVIFHAWFSPVVYFTCLGVCIGATVA